MRPLLGGLVDQAANIGGGKLPVRGFGKRARRLFVQVDHGRGAAGACFGDGVEGAGGEHVAAQHQIGFTGGDALGVDVGRRARDAHVGGHRAVLLRHAGHVERGGAFVFQMRGHPQQRAHGNHARTANARDENVVGLRAQRWQYRRGQFGKIQAAAGAQPRLAQRAAHHGHKAGAEAFDARQILIAGGLVDHALAPQRGFQRHQGGAVRLHAAIAAAFAHGLVNERAQRALRVLAFLASAALLGRAGLVINDDRHAGVVAQLALYGVQILAVVNGHQLRQAAARGVALNFFAHQRNARHAFGGHLLRQHGHGEGAVDRLTAGHGHRVVVENLVGDVHLRAHRRAQRQRTRVEIGAVAQIGKHVRALGEGRLTNPGRAFAAHLAQRFVLVWKDPRRHHMAADAGQRDAAVRHMGGRVVRAARAVIGRAHRGVDRFAEHRFLGVQKTQPRGNEIALVKARNAARNHARNLRNREIGLRREQPFAAWMHPFALIVELANDLRAHVRLPVVELLFQLVFNDLALFFHHQNFFQTAREFADAVRLEGPGHGHLEHADADGRRVVFVDAEFFQRFQHVHIGLAGGNDPKPRVGRIDGGVVEPVSARVGQRGVNLVVLHQRFLLARLCEQQVQRLAAVKAALGHDEIRREDRFDPERIGLDRRRGFHRVGQRLKAHRAAGEARHRKAVQAELDVLVDVAGIEHRNHRGRKEVVALVRQRGGIRAVVVARHQQHAAVAGGAGVVHVLEDVPAAVDARTFAIPQREHAVVVRAARQFHLLRAPYGGGGQFFVNAGGKHHVMRGEMRFGLPERFVETAQRRAAIAGNKAAGVTSGGQIAPPLDEHQADERLNAGEIHASGIGDVFVDERDLLHHVLLGPDAPGRRRWTGRWRGIDRAPRQRNGILPRRVVPAGEVACAQPGIPGLPPPSGSAGHLLEHRRHEDSLFSARQKRCLFFHQDSPK